MEIIKIENFSFKYPNSNKLMLDNINLSINKGEFVVICGMTGCGKTTLLKQLKPVISPYGEVKGNVYYKGNDIKLVDKRIQVSDIGFVNQNPENQIVTDKVWHELSFGLENLGYDTEIIRVKCAEMASYFGIEKWFYKDVSELSGGQKQILNLASVMAMNPKVLVLDEPTAQLDPISSEEFLNTIRKINNDLGVTVILTEHRLESIFFMADRVIVMEEGKIILNDSPKLVGEVLREKNNPMFKVLPSVVKIHSEVKDKYECPLTVRDGRLWLDKLFEDKEIKIKKLSKGNKEVSSEEILKLEDVYFKYEKNLEFVVESLSLKIHKGEIYSIVGGNGAGKTTTLNLIAGILKPFRGKVFYNGKSIRKYSSKELFYNNMALLSQNPQCLFVKKTVREDLEEVLFDIDISEEEKTEAINEVVKKLNIESILNMHPYDLSGGEIQKAALAKVLLLKPKLLLLDEPSKGIDNFYKDKLALILKSLQNEGITIIMVSHDIEFAAKVSDRCGMFFNGNIVSDKEPEKFFSENNFYTTSAAKISRGVFEEAVTSEDVIKLCKENLS